MAGTAREYTADDLTFLRDLLGNATDLSFSEPAPAVIQVQKYLGAIKAVENKFDQFKQLSIESSKFYLDKMIGCECQVERLRSLIIDTLNDIKLNSLATPRGTVSIRRLDKVTWPADEALLQFCKERYPELVKTSTVEKVDKKELAKLLVESADTPAGYSVEEVMTLGIRSV
jgi:hypothetical protein